MENTQKIGRILEAMKAFSRFETRKNEVLVSMIYQLQEALSDDTVDREDIMQSVESCIGQFDHELDTITAKINMEEEIPYSHAELKLFSQLSELKNNNYIAERVTIRTKLGEVVVNAVAITPKAIFLIAIDSANDNVLIDSAGKYFNIGRFVVEKRSIVERLRLAADSIKAELKVFGFENAVNVVSTLYYPYSFFGVQNKCRDVKISYAFQLRRVIDDYEGGDIYLEEDIKKIFEILSKAEDRD